MEQFPHQSNNEHENNEDGYGDATWQYFNAVRARVEKTMEDDESDDMGFADLLRGQTQLLQRAFGQEYIDNPIAVTGVAYVQDSYGIIDMSQPQTLISDTYTLKAISPYQLDDGGEVNRPWTSAFVFAPEEENPADISYVIPVDAILHIDKETAEKSILLSFLKNEASSIIKQLKSVAFLSSSTISDQNNMLDRLAGDLEQELSLQGIDENTLLSLTAEKCSIDPYDATLSLEDSFITMADYPDSVQELAGAFDGIAFIDRKSEESPYILDEEAFPYTKGAPCIMLCNQRLRCTYYIPIDAITAINDIQ